MRTLFWLVVLALVWVMPFAYAVHGLVEAFGGGR